MHSKIRSIAAILANFAVLTSFSASSSLAAQRQKAGTADEDQVVTMAECEGAGNCANWTLTGGVGLAEWRDGQRATLNIRSVRRLSDKTFALTIHRVDIGATKGAAYDYTGTLNESGRIVGEFRSTSGRPESGGWYATPGSPLIMPAIFHICAGAHCLTYQKEGNNYVNRTNLPYQQNEVRTMEVKSFTRESVSLYVYERGSFPLTAQLTGMISKDGDEMVDGTDIITSWKGHPTTNPKPETFRMAWGSSIDKIPGSDEEMAGGSYQGNGQQPSPGMTIDQTLEAAKIASQFVGYFIRYQELHPNQ